MAEQELDSLLVKIDSEIGNLQGINSAISALNRLAGITHNAKGAIKQLGELGDALQHFNGLGQRLSGLDDAEHGIHRMITALQMLTTITGSATKATNQLGRLGQVLNSSFNGIGKNLEGLEEVSRGVLNLVTALERLQGTTGNANGASRQLGNLGTQLQSFQNINLKNVADNIADPLDKIMRAIGNLGNNNTVSIRIDQGNIARVNQVMRNTRREMTDFNTWWQSISNDLRNVDMRGMFDITQPTDELERNLNRARRMITTYENRTKESLDKLRNMESSFNMADLVNRQDFRTAFRTHVLSDEMVNQIREGIDAVAHELDTRGTQEIETAWQHTLQTISDDTATFLGSDAFRNLLNVELPTEQIRANLRTVQNELSRAMNAMERAQQNMNRLRAQEPNEDRLRADAGYRGSYYTYQMNTRYAEEYRRAVQQLNAELQNRQLMPQSDIEGLRQLQPLMQQLERYREVYNQLGSQDNLSDEQMRNMSVLEQGLGIITGRIEAIRTQLDNVEPSEEGILERMRQIADETERASRRAEELNNNMRNDIGRGFSSFGSMLSGSGNQILGSIGNLSSMFGQSVSNGTAQLSGQALQGLQGVARALGTVATAVSQVVAVVGVAVAVFKTWWSIMSKVKDALDAFVKKCTQFAKDMLSKVVGAFNSVAGAVDKAVSAVKSGVQMLASALRKLEDFGKGIVSVFSKIGGAIAPALKGIKSVLSLVTPKMFKTLVTANGSLKDIVKNTRLLNKALQIANKWFTMLTRMLMRKIVQAFISGMKDAFDNLVLFEKNAEDVMLNLNTNVSYVFSAFKRLLNQLVAIFEPLINTMSEPMENFIDSLTLMAENFSKLMAILTGQPYYMRAKKFYEDYGENVDETRKKVKQLTNGLDELNILSDNNDDSDEDWRDRWEKVPLDGVFDLDPLRDLVDKIVDFLKNIDWGKLWDKIEDFIDKLMEKINYILSRLDLAEWLGKTLGNLVNTIFVILESLLDNFDPKLFADWLTTFIINALNTIDWDRIHRVVTKWATKLAEFWNEIFANEELWDSIVTTIDNFLNEIVNYFNTFAWKFDFSQMAQQLTDSIKEILQGFDWEGLSSAVEGWVTGIVDFINTAVANKDAWEELGKSIAKAVNIIIEAFNKLGDIDFAEAVDSLKLAIKSFLENIEWEEFFNAVQKWAENIADAINGLLTDTQTLADITTSIANFINGIINLFDEALIRLQGYDIGTAIANALIAGLETVQWNTLFMLPADALNALTDAIRGLLDSLPEDFSLANWLIEHLSLTYDTVDWDGLKQNIYEIGDRIVRNINDFIQSEDFWKRFGELSTRALRIVVKVTEDLTKIDWKGLAKRIKDYINGLINENKIDDIIRNIGEITIDLFFTVTAVITGVDWEALGKQIADGINDAIDKWYRNRNAIQKAIEDAFTSFSDLVSSVLRNMLKSNTFAKFGTIIGNVLLGIINGLAIFFDENSTNLVEAMKQFADSMADFLDKHHDEIVSALNRIIDGIVAIMDAFFDEKGKIWTEINRIIEELNIGKLVGSFVRNFLIKLLAKLKNLSAISDALYKGLDEFAKEVVGAIKKWIAYLWDRIKYYLFEDWTPLNIKFGEWLGQKLREALFGDFNPDIPQVKLGEWIAQKIKELFAGGESAVDLSHIFDGLSFTGLEDAWNKFKQKWENVKAWFKQKLNGLKDFFSGIFGGEKAEIPVSIEPTVDDDSKLNLEDLVNGSSKNVLEFEDASLGKISTNLIKADEIETKLITTIDIISDTLHVKDIITENGAGVLGARRMDEYYAPNEQNGIGGVLARDGSFDKITARLLEITEKITAPLLEIAEKITTELLEAKKIATELLEAKKITTELLEAKKITTDLLEAKKIITDLLEAKKIKTDLLDAKKIKTDLLETMKIVTQLFEATQINTGSVNASTFVIPQISAGSLNVSSINASTISASLLNVSGITAGTLKVGTIEGSIGGLIGGTIGGSGYSFTTPTFNKGERFSDLTGLVPSAEDFFSTLTTTVSDISDGTYWTKTDFGLYGDMENPYSKMGDYYDILSQYISDGVTNAFGEEQAVLGARREQPAGTSDIDLPDNAQYIKDYLMSFIGNEAGVYGLMGNLYAESNLRSNNLQDTANSRLGMTDEEYTDYINNGGKFTDNNGYGLAQWTTSDRKNNLMQFLNGRSVDDLDAQLEYLKYELENNYSGVLDTLKNASSIHEASTAVLTGFEKPNNATQYDALRQHYGEGIARLLGMNENTGEDEDSGATLSPFDEANVLGDKRESNNPADLLSTLFDYALAKIYDVIDTWLGRILKLVDAFMKKLYDYFKNLYDYISALSALLPVNFKIDLDAEFDGLSDKLKEELDKCMAFIDDFVAKAKKKFREVFDEFKATLDGELKVTAEANADANAWAWSEAFAESLEKSLDKVVDSINGIGGKIDTIVSGNNPTVIADIGKSIDRFGETVKSAIGNITCVCTCDKDSPAVLGDKRDPIAIDSTDIVNAIGNAKDTIANGIQDVIKSTTPSGTSNADIVSAIKEAKNAIVEAINNAKSAIVSKLESLNNEQKDLSNILNAIKETKDAIVNKLDELKREDNKENDFSNIINAIKDAKSAIVEKLNNLLNQEKKANDNSEITKAINDAKSAIVSKLDNLADKFKDEAKDTSDIVDAIKSAKSDIVGEIKNLANQQTKELDTSKMVNAINNAKTAIVNEIKNLENVERKGNDNSEVVKAVNNAKSAIVDEIKKLEQVEKKSVDVSSVKKAVDSAKSSIVSAINKLLQQEKKSVDVSAVTKAVNNAKTAIVNAINKLAKAEKKAVDVSSVTKAVNSAKSAIVNAIKKLEKAEKKAVDVSSVKKAVDSAKSSIVSAINKLAKQEKKALDISPVTKAVNNAKTAIVNAINKLLKVEKKAVDVSSITKAVDKAKTAIVNEIKKLANVEKKSIDVSSITKGIKDAKTAIVNAIKALQNTQKKNIDTSSITKAIKDAKSSIVKEVQKLSKADNDTLKAIKEAKEAIVKAIKNIKSGEASKTNLESVTKKIAETKDAIIKELEKIYKILEKILKAIQDAQKAIVDAVKNIKGTSTTASGGDVIKAVKEAKEAIVNAIKNIKLGDIDGSNIKVDLSSVMSSLTRIQELLEWVGNKIGDIKCTCNCNCGNGSGSGNGTGTGTNTGNNNDNKKDVEPADPNHNTSTDTNNSSNNGSGEKNDKDSPESTGIPTSGGSSKNVSMSDIGMWVGSKYSGKSNAILDNFEGWKNWKQDVLATAVNSAESQLNNPKATTIRFFDKDGNKITDEATLKAIKEYLINTYGITAKETASSETPTETSTATAQKATTETAETNGTNGFTDRADENTYAVLSKAINKDGSVKFGDANDKWISSSEINPYKGDIKDLENYNPTFAWTNGYETNNPAVAVAVFEEWLQRFKIKGYQMGGFPKSGEVFLSRENGTPEFVGSLGNRTVVANNDQIVTAVANGVSMANDRVVNAIEQQTASVETAIERKDMNVSIGDRQIAEANRRGQQDLGKKFVD